jgi:sporulation protein YhbH|tara:strand:+ start:1289 stop:2458 length:1170 start_codon:yes stop_codon:yes gene_type:complete
MSVFKEHKTIADRSARDRKRHKQKIERAIKDGIHDIVAEESIIGKDGKKKIKIPVRGLKEYRFLYGDNSKNQKVGSAPGKDIHRGQKIGKGSKEKPGQGDKAGNQPGEEYYEVEITLEELSKYLFDDLELPDLEKKALTKVFTQKNKRKGYRPQGITPRLDKKKSIIQKIKRAKATRRENEEEEEATEISLHEKDLVYRHFKPANKLSSNAVIFFIMDVSGSMSKEKKFMARSFYFLLYHFIRSKYEHTEIVFVAHDTGAKEVSEDQFFTRGSSGGTLVSSALELVVEIISKRYHPTNWNIYCFQCSDGDNWPEDTTKTIAAIEKLKVMSQLFGYAEIVPGENRSQSWFDESRLSNVYMSKTDKKFKTVELTQKEDIWPAFRKFFGGKV